MVPPLPSTWNTRLLASIATDLERLMRSLPDDSDAAAALFHAIRAVENADDAMPPEMEAA